jgi:hypothetical protein
LSAREWLPSSLFTREALVAYVVFIVRLAEIYVPFACRTDARKSWFQRAWPRLSEEKTILEVATWETGTATTA